MTDNEKLKRVQLLDAQSLVYQGKKEQALERYDEFLSKYPDDKSAIYGKGMAHYEFSEYDEALSYFDQILVKDENEVDSLYAKGSILSTLGKNEEALELYEKVLKIDAKMDIVWLAKGYVMLDLDKAEEALDCFKKVEKLTPGLDASNGKGHALVKLGKLKEAKICYDDAYKLDPFDPETLFGLGVIAFKRKELKEAQDLLYRSVVQDEDNLEAWKFLAKLFKQTNQTDREQIALEMMVKLTPNL